MIWIMMTILVCVDATTYFGSQRRRMCGSNQKEVEKLGTDPSEGGMKGTEEEDKVQASAQPVPEPVDKEPNRVPVTPGSPSNSTHRCQPKLRIGNSAVFRNYPSIEGKSTIEMTSPDCEHNQVPVTPSGSESIPKQGVRTRPGMQDRGSAVLGKYPRQVQPWKPALNMDKGVSYVCDEHYNERFRGSHVFKRTNEERIPTNYVDPIPNPRYKFQNLEYGEVSNPSLTPRTRSSQNVLYEPSTLASQAPESSLSNVERGAEHPIKRTPDGSLTSHVSISGESHQDDLPTRRPSDSGRTVYNGTVLHLDNGTVLHLD